MSTEPQTTDEGELQYTFIITDEHKEKFKRLDQFLSKHIPDCSRSFVKMLFQSELISSEQTKLELKKMPPVGTEVVVSIPPAAPADAEPENIPLKILFEDDHLIIIDKQPGLVVHPAPGHPNGTLVNAILYHCPDLKGVGNQKRPGIVHRLDKGTSGVMVIAKDQKTHERLVQKFSEHDIKRKYMAIVTKANLPLGGTLKSTIGRHPNLRQKMAANPPRGKDAVTHFRVLSSHEKLSLVECTLETGRTHQIRVHLTQLLSAPLLCDPLYGSPKTQLNMLSDELKNIIGDYPHPFLHAKILGFAHPITGQELFFETPPPKIFSDVLSAASLETP